MGKDLYSSFWRDLLPEIKEKLTLCENRQTQKIQLDEKSFNRLGSRPSSGYGFNIEYSNGTPGPLRKSTGKLNSAVSRDLNSEIQKNPSVLAILRRGDFKINMDSSFILWIRRT